MTPHQFTDIYGKAPVLSYFTDTQWQWLHCLAEETEQDPRFLSNHDLLIFEMAKYEEANKTNDKTIQREHETLAYFSAKLRINRQLGVKALEPPPMEDTGEV